MIALVAVVDLVIRFRRSAGVERLQFRWFVLAVAAFPVMFFATGLVEEFILGVEGFDPVVVAFALWGNGTAAAIGIAITRHGLYRSIESFPEPSDMPWWSSCWRPSIGHSHLAHFAPT